jgi:hypothetical protein
MLKFMLLYIIWNIRIKTVLELTAGSVSVLLMDVTNLCLMTAGLQTTIQ